MLGFDSFLESLDPVSLLAGILVGAVVVMAAVLVAATLQQPPKRKVDKEAVASVDLVAPVLDTNKLRDIVKSKTVAQERLSLPVATPKPPQSAAPVLLVKSADKADKVAPKRTLPPSYQYIVAGKQGTFTSLREALASGFPDVLAKLDKSHLQYDRLPLHVRQAIGREKVEQR